MKQNIKADILKIRVGKKLYTYQDANCRVINNGKSKNLKCKYKRME